MSRIPYTGGINTFAPGNSTPKSSVTVLPVTAWGTDKTDEVWPVIVSNPISATSISCPATARPATSPVPPPTASIPAAVVAARAFMPLVTCCFAFLAALIPLPPTFEATPLVMPSITPIAIPLEADLFLMLCSASSSSNTSLIPSALNSKPFFCTSSFKNSVKDNPVSKVAPAPANAPKIAPPPVPPNAPTAVPIGPPIDPAAAAAPPPANAPAPAPTPAPAATVGFTYEAIDDTNN